MGRTNPTYRNALDGLEGRWAPMRRALRLAYQDDFDRLFERARGFADAAGHANPRDPERALVLSVLLAHEVEHRRLRERCGALERELEDARKRGELDDGRERAGPATARNHDGRGTSEKPREEVSREP